MDFEKSLEQFRIAEIKAYKHIFGGAIKETFLADMLSRIHKCHRYAIIQLGTNSPNTILDPNKIFAGQTPEQFELCKMITMCHYRNMIKLNENDKGLLQKSNDYKDSLAGEVLDMFTVKKETTYNFARTSMEPFFPLFYYINSINNLLMNEYDSKVSAITKYDEESPQKLFCKIMFRNIFSRIRSCVALLDSRTPDELLILFRTLIENVMVFAAVWDESDEVVEKYFDCDRLTYEYNLNKTIPEQIKKDGKKLGTNPVNLINYGWLKNIKCFSDAKKQNYGISGIAAVLDIKCANYGKNFGTDLYKFYQACNQHVHGTLLTMNYFQTELFVFVNIGVIVEYLTDVFESLYGTVDFKIKGIDLMKKMSEQIKESDGILLWMNESEKRLEKTNLDYRDRVYCTLKMQ